MKIAQVLQSDSWGDVTPEAFQRGIGGREGAMVRLATEWARLGHEVTNFVPIKKARRFEEGNQLYRVMPDGDEDETKGFHEYVSINLSQAMLRSFPYDAVVAWECPSVFGHDDILEKQKVRLTHLQVAHFNDGEQEAAEKFSTGVVALSPWARDFLVHDGLSMSNDKLFVRPNGVNISDYPLGDVKKANMNSHNGPPSFVYSSSPDRGLWHLLKLWPKIRKEFPKANLYVGYGVSKFTEVVRWSHNRVGEMSIEIEELMEQPGVIDIGKIGQKQLASIQIKATAWLYPADTIQATETGCITAIENMAAGNPCFITDADCLKSEFGKIADVSPLPFNEDEYVGKVIEAVSYPSPTFSRMVEQGRNFAESRAWSKIAPTWIDLFKEQNGNSDLSS